MDTTNTKDTESTTDVIVEPSILFQGAEAKLYMGSFASKKCIIKERIPKTWRLPILDDYICSTRTRLESRALLQMGSFGIPVPQLYFCDLFQFRIFEEYISGCTVKAFFLENHNSLDSPINPIVKDVCFHIGRNFALVHMNSWIHGDLTTSNIMLRDVSPHLSNNPDPSTISSSIVFIDFGLASPQNFKNPEDFAVDLYVLERSLISTHAQSVPLLDSMLEGYFSTRSIHPEKYWHDNEEDPVLVRYEQVRLRGRKRSMAG